MDNTLVSQYSNRLMYGGLQQFNSNVLFVAVKTTKAKTSHDFLQAGQRKVS